MLRRHGRQTVDTLRESLRVDTQQSYSTRSRKKSIASSGAEDKSPFIFVVSPPENTVETTPKDVVFQQLQVEHDLYPVATRPTACAANDQVLMRAEKRQKVEWPSIVVQAMSQTPDATTRKRENKDTLKPLMPMRKSSGRITGRCMLRQLST